MKRGNLIVLWVFLWVCGGIFPKLVFAQTQKFNSFSLRDGLSQGTVTSITKDARGFVWVGTRNGLNRFDGYQFEILKSDSKDTASISNNLITCISSSEKGDLWVGTELGLNKVNIETLEATRYYHSFQSTSSISSNLITCVVEDDSKRVWVGTNNGLNRMDDVNKNKFLKYFANQEDEGSLSGSAITCLFIDSKNNLWVGTKLGLNKYLPEKNSFSHYRLNENDDNSLSHNEITSITEDQDGNLWIGTKHGLNRFHVEAEIFTRYFANHDGTGIIPSNVVNAVAFDNEGDMWVGTPGGLSRVSKTTRKAVFYYTAPGRTNTLPNDYIKCLYPDREGMMWIGTNAAGIATINLNAPEFYSMVYSGQQGYSPEQNRIYCFLEMDTAKVMLGTEAGIAIYQPNNRTTYFCDKNYNGVLSEIKSPIRALTQTVDGMVWIGTKGQGLVGYNPTEDTLRFYYHNPNDSRSIAGNNIYAIGVNSKGDLWVGTSGGVLNYFDRKNEIFKSYSYQSGEKTTFRDLSVKTIAVDQEDNVWFSTNNPGLYFLNSENEEIEQYITGNLQEGYLPPYRLNQIYIDSSNELWLATAGSGLLKYDKEEDKFKGYTALTGLNNDVVLAIAADKRQNLWLSTNGGISTFNYSAKTFRSYNEQTSVGQNTFYPRSLLVTQSGVVLFGGSNGFDYIYSQEIKENKQSPPVVITRFQQVNQPSKTTDVDLKKQNNTIELEFNHSGFSIEFAALNYIQPYKNRYAYRVTGLFDQWQYIGTRNFAYFTNLNPGTYIFEVKGSNNDGYWNDEPAKLQIVVKRAYWQTTWFRFSVVVAVLAMLYFYYKSKLSLEIERNQKLERAVVQRTAEIAKERDTNAVLLKEIHHRVKNNLQVIISLLNLQSRYIEDSILFDVFSEIQNRVRSMSLVHEKMYKTKDLETIDIQEYIKDLSENLINIYRLEQKIDLDIEVGVNRFNSDTLTPLGLIINEIISNALKYAFKEDKSGRIFVRLHKLECNKFRLIIGDNGIGMSPDLANENIDSFGTELISALSEQLNGTIILLPNEKGTVYKLDFEDLPN